MHGRCSVLLRVGTRPRIRALRSAYAAFVRGLFILSAALLVPPPKVPPSLVQGAPSCAPAGQR